MKRALLLIPVLLAAQVHRAEQDREIRYWLLDPATHRFRISHDFTVTRVGQKSVHSFVRAGSEVAPDSKMFDLDTGEPLHTHLVSGAEVNALGYYPTPTDPKSVVVQATYRPPWTRANPCVSAWRKAIPIRWAIRWMAANWSGRAPSAGL